MKKNYTVHHIGYAVYNIEKAIPQFEMLGYKFSKTIIDDSRGIKINFGSNGIITIELIESISNDSAVNKVIKKTRTPTPYHICYVTDNIAETCSELEEEGWILISPISPAPAINNSNVAFLSSMDIGIVEFVEISC